ncbi:MAG: DUF1989 domain-containing protein [Pseudomonadota bacterium]
MRADIDQNAMRQVYRGLKDPVFFQIQVAWGGVETVDVPAGALISVTNVDGGGRVLLTARAPEDRHFTTRTLDVPTSESTSEDPAVFDHQMMASLAAARGSSLDLARFHAVFDGASLPGDQFVTRALEDTSLYVIAPMDASYVAGGGGSSFTVRIKPPEQRPRDGWLPPPLGRVRDEWRVGRGSAKAYEVKKGQFIQIIDVEGQQCSDFMAMCARNLEAGRERYIDSTVSRTKTHSAYPLPGLFDKFYDQDINPLLSVRQDTVGRHDTFALACTANGYEERGFPGHLNCSDNISAAFSPFGIGKRAAWPAINFFFNSWINWTEHGLVSDEAWSRPGDYVAMQALTDLVCVSTACPDDIDPINGWNPTDIHVRIYEEDTSISHSVSWRSQPEDSGKLTRHSAFHPRTSALTSRFVASRDLWVPARFDGTGAVEEYWACKNAATLQDMSGLYKFDVVGPDAEALLQACLTRDVSKLSLHRGFYALVCDERGSVLDDGTLFRIEQTAFRWCCGSENSALHLREQAEALSLNARVLSPGNRLVNLAVQGPKSRDILRDLVITQATRPALDALKWFGFTIGRLGEPDGPSVMVSRSGFTGELGYEIFCDQDDALWVWDLVMEAGASYGLVPMGGEALSMLRIEAGLMVAGAEFGPDSDAFESGLGFAVDFKKKAFIGRAALERNAAAPRRTLVGLTFPGSEAPHHGDRIFSGREQVGVVTSGTYSPELGTAIAMARIAVENAEAGTTLEAGKLDGHMKRLPCTVVDLPFLDPKREKARA